MVNKPNVVRVVSESPTEMVTPDFNTPVIATSLPCDSQERKEQRSQTNLADFGLLDSENSQSCTQPHSNKLIDQPSTETNQRLKRTRKVFLTL